jgi:hypothetical protein
MTRYGLRPRLSVLGRVRHAIVASSAQAGTMQALMRDIALRNIIYRSIAHPRNGARVA